MALQVTPTSGAGPYTLTLDLAHKSLVEGVRYKIEARLGTNVGACVVPGGENNSSLAAQLLNIGSYTRNTDVPVGSCASYKIDIVDMKTSEIISTQSVSIDNV